jgi:hypothetical protein
MNIYDTKPLKDKVFISHECLADDHQSCEDGLCACWCHFDNEAVDFSEYDEIMKHFDDETED